MSIEHLTEIVGELETKYAEMKKELEKLWETKFEAHKNLFRTRFARAKAAVAENNEEVILEFMKYVVADEYNTIDLWHPVGGISYELWIMSEKLISTAKSQELIDAAERVCHLSKCNAYAYDEKLDDSDPDME